MSLDIRPNPTASGGSVTGALVYKGSYNATTSSPSLVSAEKGDFYIVNVAGSLAGVTLNVGDHIVFNQNAANPVTSSMFDVIDNTDAVASVNTKTGVVVLDTDDVGEGSNLYYTTARFDTQLATKDTGDLTEGSNLYYTNGRADGRISAANLTDLNDVNYTAGAGIDNYVLTYNHSNTRWEAEASPTAPVSSVNTKTGAVVLDTDDVGEGSNLYYTTARFDTQLATKDTGDLTEGSNLYYTNGRADGRISAANLTDLNDVNYTAGAGIDNYVLTYNHSNTRWEAEASPSAPVSSVNTKTGAVVLDTDDVGEGSNLYYTNARFDTQLATKDTGDLTEGSNLYYTNARADGRISAANLTDLNDVNYTAGAGIDNYVLTYNHSNTRWEAEAATGGGSAPNVSKDSSETDTTISTKTGIEEIHLIDNDTTAVTITIPTASTATSGYKYNIKRLGTANVTIQSTSISAGNNQIDGSDSYVLELQYEAVTLVSNGTTYFII